MNPLFVTKADGTRELFKETKVRQSLKKAGASNTEIEDIMHGIERELVDGMKTDIIYRRAFELLRALPQPVAARYSLRRALFGLGPTGFPFEDYLAHLYEHEGYTTKTRVILKGACTRHEIDVIAWRPDDTVVVEAKFHLQPGTKSDLQVALYSYARFLDLKAEHVHGKDTKEHRRAAVITNTKFTTAAIEYGMCKGLELIGWDHPKGKSLQEWIERSKLYPITVLSTLKPKEKLHLIQSGSLLCKEVLDSEEKLFSAGVSRQRVATIMTEGGMLCGM
jgi:hypothetical protein